MKNKFQATAFLIAGGKSSRMGTDKGLLDWFGIPIAQHILSELKKCFEEVVIVSNSEEYYRFGLRILKDEIPEQGPLGGIYTALKHTETPDNFIISCDMPKIQKEAISYFLQHCDTQNFTIATLNNELQPLFGYYTKTLEMSVLEAIQQKKLKLKDFIVSQKYSTIEMSLFKEQFTNLNTPLDYFLSRRITIPV